jgi:hypothetical protein
MTANIEAHQHLPYGQPETKSSQGMYTYLIKRKIGFYCSAL